MDELSREDILETVTPDELFGEAAFDRRELRRSFAKLAKAWRADTEVTVHIRSLFEQARTQQSHGPPSTIAPEPSTDVLSDSDPPIGGAPVEPEDEGPVEPVPTTVSPRDPLDLLNAAHERGDLAGVLNALVDGRKILVRQEPELVARSLSILIAYGGPGLSDAALDVIELIVEDNTFEAPPSLITQWRLDVDKLRSLKTLAPSDAVPEAVVVAIRRLWAEPAHVSARILLELKRELGTADLQAICRALEDAHPTAFGLLCLAEIRILDCVAGQTPPISQSELNALADTYPEGNRHIEQWAESIDAFLDGYPMRIGMTLLFAVPLWLVVGGGAILLAVLLRIAFVSTLGDMIGTLAVKRVIRQFYAQPIDELLSACQRTATFPRELAALVHGPLVMESSTYAYAPNHPLLRLDASPANVLAVLTDAHVARLVSIVEDSHHE